MTKSERFSRAQWWPIVIIRYFVRLRKLKNHCAPPLGWFETWKLAETHTHSWIWGNIGYNDLYLPTAQHPRAGGKPDPEPPEWFAKLYNDYLKKQNR